MLLLDPPLHPAKHAFKPVPTAPDKASHLVLYFRAQEVERCAGVRGTQERLQQNGATNYSGNYTVPVGISPNPDP